MILHNWQRWGYDYRLPDIFPPNPALGTPADVQELGRLCGVRGVPWALHDNYIDLYPDATGFTYDDVTFHADGRPRRASCNQGRQAQSFQFRPDRFQPYLQRNLAAIVPALRPTASFVDVFASLQVFDFHDRDGRRHSRLEAQRAWGEAFAAIREACGGDAPTISEAGGDQLVGWLEGSDAQFISLGPVPQRLVRRRPRPRLGARPLARCGPALAVQPPRGRLLRPLSGRPPPRGARHRDDDYLSAELLTGPCADDRSRGAGARRGAQVLAGPGFHPEHRRRRHPRGGIRRRQSAPRDGDLELGGARVGEPRRAGLDGRRACVATIRIPGGAHGAIGSAVERRGGRRGAGARPGAVLCPQPRDRVPAPAAPAAVDFGFVRTDGALRSRHGRRPSR